MQNVSDGSFEAERKDQIYQLLSRRWCDIQGVAWTTKRDDPGEDLVDVSKNPEDPLLLKLDSQETMVVAIS